MVQEILTYIIVLLAFGITLFKSLRSIIRKKKNTAASCSTCSSGACGSCSLNTVSKEKPTLPIRVLHDEIK